MNIRIVMMSRKLPPFFLVLILIVKSAAKLFLLPLFMVDKNSIDSYLGEQSTVNGYGSNIIYTLNLMVFSVKTKADGQFGVANGKRTEQINKMVNE